MKINLVSVFDNEGENITYDTNIHNKNLIAASGSPP